MITKVLLGLALTAVLSTAQATETFKLKYLRNVTPEEVLPVALGKINVDIEKLFGGEAPLFIDAKSFEKLHDISVGSIYDLSELTNTALTRLNKTEFTYSEFTEAMADTVYDTYNRCTIYVDGKKVVVNSYESKKVDKNQCSFLSYYLGDSLNEARYTKAMKLAKNTSAYKIKDLFQMWEKGVSDDGNNLDNFYELPRVVTGEYSPEALYRAMGFRGYFTLEKSGPAAIDAFFSGGESPDPLFFGDMIQALKSSKHAEFYFFTAGGENWSRYSLLIVDEHHQVYTFTMGYSE